MGNFANVKHKRLIRFLKSLSGLELCSGGKHCKVKIICTGKVFTVPTIHGGVDKHIVSDLCNLLIKNEICTEEQFRKGI
ncbi:MAG: hypothetical protein COY66_05090 [Candidatus Kerfeldbacteria bacterium CG_4_10_14_0_8_um_filter_42_10]|uniref:Type II toxin-antitoxin system HicA family toxin n=1 Tax=Candidatus Kerfeldbacteria bacterium CG_4_10_14_0_8_um_filter_42_10 TaxID=2014248 RepID=A0A2M7RH82_9BACT|nr:MAG: hypothetical protein COY66_05090 [Candidatus Kerfeldbacteria bacterium CG_4_10_14_0_8_um_filter_42_10]